MKKIIWKIEPLGLPTAWRHCKKCGQKAEFICSGQFRVNAQRKTLDVWLIYKCAKCDTTWNAAVRSRVSPQALKVGRLEGFFSNDEALVRQYAMDLQFLRGNGARPGLPPYTVSGGNPVLGEPSEVAIQSAHALPIKVSALVRDKLRLSQKAYLAMVSEGRIMGRSGEDLRRCRVKEGLVLIFQ